MVIAAITGFLLYTEKKNEAFVITVKRSEVISDFNKNFYTGNFL